MKKQKENLSIGYYLGKHKMAIGVYLFLYTLASIISVFITILTADAIEDVTLKLFDKTITLMIIILAITFVRRICWYLTNIIYSKYSLKIMSEMNSDLARQAFKLNSKSFSAHDTGTFVQRIVTDPERVIERFAHIVNILSDIVTAAIMVVYIIVIDIIVGLIVLGILAIGFVAEMIRINIKLKNRKAVRDMNDKITSLTTEIVRSEKDIKSLGLEDELLKVSNDNYNNYRKAVIKHDITDLNFWCTRNFVLEVSAILILVLSILLMNKGLLTLASFMIIYTNHGRLHTLIWGLGNIMSDIVDIKVSSARMFSLFDEKEFVTEKFGKTTLDKVVGDIEVKDATFYFREHEYIEEGKKKKQVKLVSERKIFEHLSFKIPHNKTVAFVGKSGSGKSTILNILSRMYRVSSGEVLIDGHNIDSLDKATLRKTFSLVNQFPYVFDMTIKENLLLAKEDATDEEIANVLKLACLEDFVAGLKKGLNTRLGESGVKLSGGQKQRLAIARALLRDTPVILFDESTSALDNFAQEQVKRSIDGLKGRSTIVIVAHRLSTIKDADIIFFLDEGKVVDKGTFKELYKNNPKFKSMFLAENV